MNEDNLIEEIRDAYNSQSYHGDLGELVNDAKKIDSKERRKHRMPSPLIWVGIGLSLLIAVTIAFSWMPRSKQGVNEIDVNLPVVKSDSLKRKPTTTIPKVVSNSPPPTNHRSAFVPLANVLSTDHERGFVNYLKRSEISRAQQSNTNYLSNSKTRKPRFQYLAGYSIKKKHRYFFGQSPSP